MTTQATTMLDVGERLRVARERADVSVQQMADALGRHRNAVTRYERSDDPPLWVMRRYVEELGNVSLEWLVAEVGESPSRAAGAPGTAGCLTLLEDSEQLSLLVPDDLSTLTDREIERRRVEALCTNPALLAELGLGVPA